MAEQSKIRMTAAEFFQLPETNQPTELIQGELIVSPTPTPLHQRSLGKLYRVLVALIPNGEVFFAPLSVYLDEENIPEPDLVWVAEGSRCVIGEKQLEGPPDLVVEVFSPGTARRDRREKHLLYEKHGVREYWMADPTGRYLEVCRLVDGKFVQQDIYGPGDTFESAVLGGKTVVLSDIFEE